MSMSFNEAFDLLRFWFDMEISLESDSDEPDAEYKEVLAASQIVFKEVNRSRSEHVAWMRYVEHPERATQIRLCNSDDDGAFPVYRIKQPEKAVANHG